MSDFLTIKQYKPLYETCLQADTARTEGNANACYDAVVTAFSWILEDLCASETDMSREDMLTKLKDKNILTERSLAVYREYLLSDVSEVSQVMAENAYQSLAEEVEKYAKYYKNGLQPKTTEEILTEYSDGKHSTRSQRSGADFVFRIVINAGFMLAGLCMILLSVFVPKMSNWLLGGIVFVVFGGLLYSLYGNIKK